MPLLCFSFSCAGQLVAQPVRALLPALALGVPLPPHQHRPPQGLWSHCGSRRGPRSMGAGRAKKQD